MTLPLRTASKHWALTLLLILIVEGGIPAWAREEPDGQSRILAMVGGQPVTSADVDAWLEGMEEARRQAYQTDEAREGLVREIVGLRLMALEAERVGLASDPEFLEQLGRLRTELLARLFMTRRIIGKVEVTETDARHEYDEHLERYWMPEMIKAPSILVRIPAGAPEELVEAKRLRMFRAVARLNGGVSFQEVAKEFSESNFSDDEYFSRGRLSPAIEQKVFALEVGQLSQVFELDDGLRVFKLADRRLPRLKSFSEVKEAIMAEMRARKLSEAFQAELERLADEYTVEYPAATESGRARPDGDTPRREVGEDLGLSVVEGIVIRITAGEVPPLQEEARPLMVLVQITQAAAGGGLQRGAEIVLLVPPGVEVIDERQTGLQVVSRSRLSAEQYVRLWLKGPVSMSQPAKVEAEKIAIIPTPGASGGPRASEEPPKNATSHWM